MGEEHRKEGPAGSLAQTTTDGQAATVLATVAPMLIGRPTPLLLGLDGPSGSGKSTLAQALAEALDAAVVPTDDFYAAYITDAGWDARTPAMRAADVLDWRRLRREALVPLRLGRPARWRTYDFAAGARPDGTYAMQDKFEERLPARVIIADGAYATQPALRSLYDLTILVDAPKAVRCARLAAREEPDFLERWYARWDAVEAYYFTQVRPPSAFDLVIMTAL